MLIKIWGNKFQFEKVKFKLRNQIFYLSTYIKVYIDVIYVIDLGHYYGFDFDYNNIIYNKHI